VQTAGSPRSKPWLGRQARRAEFSSLFVDAVKRCTPPPSERSAWWQHCEGHGKSGIRIRLRAAEGQAFGRQAHIYPDVSALGDSTGEIRTQARSRFND
jgi:hypothetical protein